MTMTEPSAERERRLSGVPVLKAFGKFVGQAAATPPQPSGRPH